MRSTKPGQREAEGGEFGVVRAHAAHGDEADAFFGFHNLMIVNKVRVPPAIKLKTGTVKMRYALGKCAMIAQPMGMVIAPTTNAPDARLSADVGDAEILDREPEEQVHRAQPEERDVTQPIHPPAQARVAAEPVLTMKEKAEHHAGNEAEQNPKPGQDEVQLRDFRFHLGAP